MFILAIAAFIMHPIQYIKDWRDRKDVWKRQP